MIYIMIFILSFVFGYCNGMKNKPNNRTLKFADRFNNFFGTFQFNLPEKNEIPELNIHIPWPMIIVFVVFLLT